MQRAKSFLLFSGALFLLIAALALTNSGPAIGQALKDVNVANTPLPVATVAGQNKVVIDDTMPPKVAVSNFPGAATPVQARFTINTNTILNSIGAGFGGVVVPANQILVIHSISAKLQGEPTAGPAEIEVVTTLPSPSLPTITGSATRTDLVVYDFPLAAIGRNSVTLAAQTRIAAGPNQQVMFSFDTANALAGTGFVEVSFSGELLPAP